jgi:hypothetical protein
MTLGQATAALLAAIEAEDLEGVTQALAARTAIIEAGAGVTLEDAQEALDGGERAAHAMEFLKLKWALESARLSQMQSGFALAPDRQPFQDFVG